MFDTIGRKKMIAGTYFVSGTLLGQGLQMPRHVAGAVIEQLGSPAGGQRPLPQQGLEQGDTHGVGDGPHGPRGR
jgi:hypothetical protein